MPLPRGSEFLKYTSMPVHVAHLVWSFDIGGMENGIVNLINKSNPQTTRYSVIALTNLGLSKSRVQATNVSFFELGKGAGNDWGIIGHLARIFRRIKPDIVHTHGWPTYVEGLLGAFLGKVPVLIHGEHGTTFFEKRRRVLAYRILKKWTTHYTVVSSSLRRPLEDVIGIPSKKIISIPNGVDLERFNYKPLVRKKVRHKLGIDKDEFVVGSVGRLVPVKGFEVFVESIKELAACGERVRGLLVGQGTLYDKLRRLSVNGNGMASTMFLGNRDDVDDILQAFDVYVSTSYSEGMSNTILEAMASRIPIIATAVGGTVELVRANSSGILIAPGDSKKLSRSLMYRANNPEERVWLGSGARTRCEMDFSLDSMINRYESLYQSCIDHSSENENLFIKQKPSP